MNLRVSMVAATVFGLSLSIGSPTWADVVSADGFGDTASSAITNAAMNAIRSVAGSRMTIKQDFTSEIVNGVPDEKFIEKMLETSSGTVKHLQILSVKQIGDVFQASVTVDVDPGKLDRQGSAGGQVSLKPGTFAGGVAEAELKKGAAEQVQDALNEYLSVSSKSVEILTFGAEKNEDILDIMRADSLLKDGDVAVRLVLKVSTDPEVIEELKNAITAASKEIKIDISNDKWASGKISGAYSCENNPPPKSSFQVAFLGNQKTQSDVGYISCGTVYADFVTKITGAPSKLFSVSNKMDIGKAFDNSSLHIRLFSGEQSLKEFEMPVNAVYGPAFQEGPVLSFPVTNDGQVLIPKTSPGRDVNPLGSQMKFSPTILIGEEFRSDPSGWILVPEMSYAFSFAIGPDVANTMDSVKADITSP